MNGRFDLTRWNRAGLTRFRYVDGNAATYLEELRRSLAATFPQWTALPGDAVAGETDAQRLERLLAVYGGERRDWGWEIARSFARACHVLLEHVDAYANEGYLGTATQWDNVRRLVEMLDYHLAPPASASALLVLDAEEGASGTVEKSFQVKHSPPEGGAPVIFETLANLEVDAGLDALRLAGWNRSVETFRVAPAAGGAGSAAVSRRPAIDVQGVGAQYSRQLNTFLQTMTGHPMTFTLADLAGINPASRPGGISETRLWEFKTKAQIVLEPAGGAPEGLLGRTLAGIAAMPATPEVADVQRHLRRVQLALDETAFRRVRLRDLATGAPAATAAVWTAPEDLREKLSAGQLALLARATEAAVVYLEQVDAETGEVELRDAPSQPEWRDWTKGETRLLLDPESIRTPRLHGPGVATLARAHGLAAGDVAAWRQGGAWRFAAVAEADELAFRISGATPPPGTGVYRALTIERGAGGLLFPHGYRGAARRTGAAYHQLSDADSTVRESHDDSGGVVGRYRELIDGSVLEIALVAQDAEPIGRAAAATAGEYLFDGDPGELAGGRWVVADDGTVLRALVIDRINEREDHFAVLFRAPPESPRQVAELPVAALQDAGTERARAFAGHGVDTLDDLARADLGALTDAIPPEVLPAVRLWELHTKAGIVLGFAFSATDYAAVLDRSLQQLAAAPVDELAAETARSEAEIEALQSALRQVQIALDETAFEELTLRQLLPAGAGPDRLVRLYGPFAETLRPAGWDRNATPVEGSRLALAAAELPQLLIPGRELILEQEAGDGWADAVKAAVTEVDTGAGAIEIAPALDAGDGFTLGNTVIRGNVTDAGHGETRPEKVLGSGDATRSGQRFLLEVAEVSFVADATQPTGVRADIEVQVAGRTWQQRATLNDSEPADPHYTVRMTEDSFLAIRFGDGRHGRRLPTGTNNVRVGYRVGTGLAGNLDAGSLDKAVRPHRLVAAVRQPMAATGGNDMEDLESLRTNAPASVLTFERAVSLSDFARLAASQSSVWQAAAFTAASSPRDRARVEVVVVPAGGGALGDLQASLQAFLQQHALPNVEVGVSGYTAEHFDLEVTAQVISAQFDPEVVLQNLRAALFETFTLRLRGLGQDLYLSEVYKVVEAVVGVESSLCVIDGDPALRRRKAAEHGVLYLEPDVSRLVLESEEFQL